MQDTLDIERIDAEGMDEIRLIANLMIAAATARDHVTPHRPISGSRQPEAVTAAASVTFAKPLR